MPLFDYICQECHFIQADLLMHADEAELSKVLPCPQCKKQTNHVKAVGSFTPRFKGSGWTTPSHGSKHD